MRTQKWSLRRFNRIELPGDERIALKLVQCKLATVDAMKTKVGIIIFKKNVHNRNI
jgi:hypothetical protein